MGKGMYTMVMDVLLTDNFVLVIQYVAKKRLSHCKKDRAIQHNKKILLGRILEAWKVSASRV